MEHRSLLSYYETKNIDPVPIALNSKEEWRKHLSKRRNLYELHLGIPLKFLKDCRVLEFGCNTGENALVLAHFGARLTLVEPHSTQHAPLLSLFEKFDLKQQIEILSLSTAEDFQTAETYDLVICENFINCLAKRDDVLRKICRLISQNGFGVISYDDNYGSMIEVIRQLLFRHACKLQRTEDLHSETSLTIASLLFSEDFNRINASRPFSAWWQDVLLNPFVSWRYLWTLPEVLRIIENSGCEYISGSPGWVDQDRFTWYKNVVDCSVRHRGIIESWKDHFSFFLTGLRIRQGQKLSASNDVIDATGKFLASIEDYIADPAKTIESVVFPETLNCYLSTHRDERIVKFGTEIKTLFDRLPVLNFEEMIELYHQTEYLRNLWGTPCQYVCFRRNIPTV